MIVTDIFGAAWQVTRADPTRLAFDLLRGRPHPPTRQGETVILTDDLAQVLEALRDAPSHLTELLPLGATAVKRLRRLLGHNRYDDRLDWYLARIDDLGAMTGLAFAAAHGVSEAAASIWRTRLLGPRLRPAGWWRAADVRDTILTGTTRDAAAVLGIAVVSVRRIRWQLQQEGLTDDPA